MRVNIIPKHCFPYSTLFMLQKYKCNLKVMVKEKGYFKTSENKMVLQSGRDEL